MSTFSITTTVLKEHIFSIGQLSLVTVYGCWADYGYQANWEYLPLIFLSIPVMH